tara:strand:+ start:6134 stop:6286 length:153 start_codon:yes stop_codon:yes gene_type:complete
MTNEEKLQNLNKQLKECEVIYYKLQGAIEVLTENPEEEEVKKEGKSKKSK